MNVTNTCLKKRYCHSKYVITVISICDYDRLFQQIITCFRQIAHQGYFTLYREVSLSMHLCVTSKLPY